MRVKNIGFWIILFSIITLIFFPAIIYPFFQDDFFALVTTKITSLGDIWRLFLPVAEAVYSRPLGIQLYFGLMQFFGLGQPIWFHLVSLLVHLLNTYLVYRLIRSLRATGGSVAISRIAKLTAFLWGTSPIHYFALGWAVNFSFILVVTWSILAILASREGKIFQAIVFLILGLATNEMAVVIPGLVILATGRKRIRLAGSMLAGVAFYVIWRLTVGIKVQGDYALSLVAPISAFRWYGLWILGWSDIVRDFIRWGIVFRSEFTKIFPGVVSIYLIEIGVLIWLAKGEWKNKMPVKYFLWIIIGLTPVLLFQSHLYSHYAAIAAIGFYWWLAEIVVKRERRLLLMLTWVMVAAATLGLSYKVSWMADHAAESQRFQRLVLDQTQKGEVSRIYIVSNVPRAQTVLLGGYGIEYLTGVNRDKVIFVSSLNEVPEGLPDWAVISL